MKYLIIIAVAIISYLIGSINFSIILSKVISGKDIRESGSGNAGATNMLRTHGKKMGIITLLLDVLKGIIAILLAMYLRKIIWNGDILYEQHAMGDYLNILPYIAGVCVILGHNFPIYFGFKGGKGVATSLGVVLMLDWKVGLIVMVIALAIMAITHYVSLGSIIGGMLYIALEIVKAVETYEWSIVTEHQNPQIEIQLVCVIIIGGLLIARHHANIKRLLNGTENKLSFSKKEK